jgi:hypothetical protein
MLQIHSYLRYRNVCLVTEDDDCVCVCVPSPHENERHKRFQMLNATRNERAVGCISGFVWDILQMRGPGLSSPFIHFFTCE